MNTLVISAALLAAALGAVFPAYTHAAPASAPTGYAIAMLDNDERGEWNHDGRDYRSQESYHDRDRDRDRIVCESVNRSRNYCAVEMRVYDVRVRRQMSGVDCVEGRTWGHSRRGIWVDHGCRAEFAVTGHERRR